MFIFSEWIGRTKYSSVSNDYTIDQLMEIIQSGLAEVFDPYDVQEVFSPGDSMELLEGISNQPGGMSIKFNNREYQLPNDIMKQLMPLVQGGKLPEIKVGVTQDGQIAQDAATVQSEPIEQRGTVQKVMSSISGKLSAFQKKHPFVYSCVKFAIPLIIGWAVASLMGSTPGASSNDVTHLAKDLTNF